MTTIDARDPLLTGQLDDRPYYESYRHAGHFRSKAEEFESVKMGMWLFLTTEILAGASTIVSGIIVQDTVSETVKAQAAGVDVDLQAQEAIIATGTTVNRISFGIFAGVALVGILQAQLGFVSERSYTRKRDLKLLAPPPPPPRVAPTVSFGPGGASFGLVGRF